MLKPAVTVDGFDRFAITAQLPANAVAEPGVTGDYAWASMGGLPVAVIPIGRSAVIGLPFAIQIGARPHADADCRSRSTTRQPTRTRRPTRRERPRAESRERTEAGVMSAAFPS